MAFDTLQVKAVEGLLQIRSAIDQPAHHQHGVGGDPRHEKSPLPRIKCVVKGFVKATFARF